MCFSHCLILLSICIMNAVFVVDLSDAAVLVSVGNHFICSFAVCIHICIRMNVIHADLKPDNILLVKCKSCEL